MLEWNNVLLQRLQPKALLFDLDGTLVDSVPSLAQAVDAMLHALGYPPAGEQQVRLWVGNGAERLIRRALACGDETAALALNKDVVACAGEHFNHHYMQAVQQAAKVYDGVEYMLANLPVPAALVTNKPRQFTEPLLESLAWQSHFPVLICGDDLATKKPSAEPLLFACQALAVDATQALMVGDSRTDIAAARAAGMACAAVTYGYNHGEPVAQSEPDWLLDNVLELFA